jgi:hypothetical protein
MRTLPGVALTLTLGVLLGCARGGTPAPPATTLIELSLVNGSIVVSPDSAIAERNGNVRWRSANPGAVWVVVFPQTTPFANQQRVLNGGGNPSHAQAPIPGSGAGTTVAHKYWVFYPDGSGGYVVEDPKLVIVDDKSG